MNKAASVVGAAGVGAGLMYLFDPDRGKRRRAKVRNKAMHIKRVASDYAGKTQRDVRNRISGVIAETEALFHREKVSDNVLEARVRSKLGRIVSHPHAVQVKVADSVVTLSGPILANEEVALCDAVRSIDGVKNVENLLETHEDAGNIPALQDGRRRFRESFKSTWSPATRLVAGVAGGALTVCGGKQRGVSGALISSLGLCVLARALTNANPTDWIGIDAENKPIEIAPTDTAVQSVVSEPRATM